MKRIVLIILSLVIIVLGTLVAIPLFFKDRLLQQVKTTINNQVNASVEFDDFKVSLFNDFPKVQLKLEGLTLTGTDVFEHDTLVAIQELSTHISLNDLFRNEGFEISSLTIHKPFINLISKKTGDVNWDIAKKTESDQSISKPEEEADNKSGFKLKLSDIVIKDLDFIYDDENMPMRVSLKGTRISSFGELEGSITRLNIKASVNEFLLDYDSIRYLSKTTLKAESQLEADYEQMSFQFQNAKFWLNNLPLELTGNFKMPDDNILFDLSFRSEKSDFSTLLALVPGEFQSYLDQVEAEGSAEFSGCVKGLYNDDTYPAFEVHLGVTNSTFKYKELPESINEISISASIQKPQGKLELLSVSVEKAHASIRNNAIDLNLKIKDIMTDPAIKGSFSGTVNFATLKQAIPVESLDVSGILKAKLNLDGKVSAIEKHDFSSFKSEGEAILTEFVIVSDQFNKPLDISLGKIKITTDRINIETIKAKVGQSDFLLNGYVGNYLPYIFNNETLKGSFRLNSTFINLTELSYLQSSGNNDKKESSAQQDQVISAEDSILAFQIPAHINLSFTSDIRKALFDKMTIENIKGLIRVNNEQLDLSGLSMNMLKGKLTMNGMYKGNKRNMPDFDFKMDITQFDVPSAYRSLSMVKRYVPIAAKSQGTFSTKLTLSGKMNEKLELVPTTLDGKGLLNTQNLMIIDSPTFDQIKGIVKKEKLKNVKVDDFTAKIEIEDGKLLIEPFKTSIADQQTTLYGSVSATQELELNMDFLVNRDDLSEDINKGLGILPGSQNIKMIDVSVRLRGPIKKPEVSLDLSKAKKQIEEEVKKASVEEIKKSVKKVGDELKKLFK